MADVTLRSVVKRFGGVGAVGAIDLDIPNNEFVVLGGRSGCGKSTTLRMIAGLEEVTSGDIYIGGELVNDLPPKDRDIAMVFQNYALYPHMTAFENMSFGLRLRKVPRAEIRERVGHAARILDITDLLDRRPKALSGGQRQRVAMGRAIVRNPRVFLFDEPLSNLDAKLRVQMGRAARSGTGGGWDLLGGLGRGPLTEPRHERDASCEFSVTLDVVEPMGMETMVFFTVNGQEVCGRVDPASSRGPGEPMRL